MPEAESMLRNPIETVDVNHPSMPGDPSTVPSNEVGGVRSIFTLGLMVCACSTLPAPSVA